MNCKVRELFKTLLYMGKDYPERSGGYTKFSSELKRVFRSTPIQDEASLVKALEKGEYVKKELEALYFLTRYRDMKRKYYDS